MSIPLQSGGIVANDESLLFAQRSPHETEYIHISFTGIKRTIWRCANYGTDPRAIWPDGRAIYHSGEHGLILVTIGGQVISQLDLKQEFVANLRVTTNGKRFVALLYTQRPPRGLEEFPQTTSMRFAVYDSSTLKELTSEPISHKGHNHVFSWDVDPLGTIVSYILDYDLMIWRIPI